MRFRTLQITILAVLASSQILLAAEIREISGRQYARDGQGWQQITADGQRFDVDARVITIKLRPGVTAPAALALHHNLGGTPLRQARTGYIDVEIRRGQDPLDAIDAYVASGLVATAEPNTIGRYHLVPDDPSYGSQWHWPKVMAEEAWDTTAGHPSAAVVAVLDSGTEFDHEDLGTGGDAYQNVWLNSGEDAWSDPDDPDSGNGLDDDSNGFIDDWKGWNFGDGDNDPSGSFFHGTAVAGVVAAKTNNAVGVAGAAGGWGAPGARVMIAGVGNNSPNGAVLDDAILYAAENGADVIQLSLSVSPASAIDDALEMAYDVFGVTIICSSGNGGGNSVGYPSSDSHVIAVGSTNQSDQRSGFSQGGPDLEISAPGEDIWTLDLFDNYGPSSGTSFSAPLVSGVVALMLASNPGMTNTQIRQTLHDTADKVGGYDYDWDPGMPGHSQELGYGRVNAETALMGGSTIFTDGFESGDTTAWSSSQP